MSIRKKLLINALGIIVFSVVLIALVIYSMLSIQSSGDKIMDKFVAISTIRSDYFRVQDVLNNYANKISVVQPQSITAETVALIENDFSKIESNITILEAEKLTEIEQHALTRFLTEHQLLKESIQAVQNKDASSVRSYAARVNAALNHIEKLAFYTDTESKIIAQQLDADIQSTIRIAIGGVIFIVLLGGITTFFTTRRITKPLRELSNRAELIAAGQLSVEPLAYKGNDEITLLNESFSKMTGQLKELLNSIRQVSTQVEKYSNDLLNENHVLQQISYQVTDSTSVLSQGTGQIANSLGETVQLVEHMVNDFSQNEQRSQYSVARSQQAAAAIQRSQEAITLQQTLIQHNIETTNDIHEVSSRFFEYTSSIEAMAKVVANIADQTNLLALNASIEAARAGEHGKGFAVVAEEVRKLAEQSNVSTTEIFTIVQSIKQGIHEMTNSIKTGVDIANQQQSSIAQTTEAFTQIEDEMQAVMHEISSVAEHLKASREASTTVLQNVAGVNAFVEQTANESQDIAHATNNQLQSFSNVVTKVQQLQQLIADLNTHVNKFKMD